MTNQLFGSTEIQYVVRSTQRTCEVDSTFNSVQHNCPYLVVTAQLFVWTTIPTAVLPARSTRLRSQPRSPPQDRLYHRWSTTTAGQSFFIFTCETRIFFMLGCPLQLFNTYEKSVSRHKFWHRHEKRKGKANPMSPHNLSMYVVRFPLLWIRISGQALTPQ